MKKKYYFRIFRKANSKFLKRLDLESKMRIFMDVGEQLGFGHFLPCEIEVKQAISLLDADLSKNIKVAIDAGAHIGVYSEALLEAFPNLTLVQFEPNPSAYEYLKNRFKSDPRVKTENMGLSANGGTYFLHSSSDFDASANASKNPRPDTFSIDTVSLDFYLAQKDFKQIDWLKIDVEGLDFEVLKGFERNFRNTTLIQFEISSTSLGQARLLDFWLLLSESHSIYRISPVSGPIRIHSYASSEEIFWGTNYLAIKR